MSRSSLLGFLAAAVVAGCGAATEERSTAESSATPAQALLVVDTQDGLVVDGARVSLVTPEGKRLDVPDALRASPYGLSPDGRSVAAVIDVPGSSDGDVTVTPLEAQGSTRVVASGRNPSFAWRPDGALAVASTSGRQGTRLRVLDQAGRMELAYSFPVTRDPYYGYVEHTYSLLSWSPDGSRLLVRQGGYTPYGVLVLDIRSKTLRMLAENTVKDDPSTVEWSPDGRFVLLAGGEGFSMQDFVFAVIDVADATATLWCAAGMPPRNRASSTKPCPTPFAGVPAAVAWAADGSGIYARSASIVERIDLDGSRHEIVSGVTGFGLATLDDRVVAYDDARTHTVRRRTLGTGAQQELLATKGRFVRLVAVRRLPPSP